MFPLPIIDFFGYVPHEAAASFIMESVIQQEGYPETFGSGLAKNLHLDAALLDDLSTSKDKLERFNQLRNQLKYRLSAEESVRKQKEIGVQHSVVFCTAPEEARLLSKFDSFIIPFLALDPLNSEGVAIALDAIENDEVAGLCLTPFVSGIPPDDGRYSAIYEVCETRGLPIWIHCSANRKPNSSNYLGHPKNIEKVAMEYPKLKIVAGHGGWPWLHEMVMLAWNYENIYIDISAHRPKYMEKSGSGWEPLLNYGQTVIRNKVLFGSAWQLMAISQESIIQEILALDLSDETKERWLYKNAAELLAIPNN